MHHQCSEMSVTSQTGASLGCGELVAAPALQCYFYFLEGQWVEGESHTPAKIKWLQESGSWTVTREVKDGRMLLALRPDTGDSVKLTCISNTDFRSPNNLCDLGISSIIVFYTYTLAERNVFWSRTSTQK